MTRTVRNLIFSMAAAALIVGLASCAVSPPANKWGGEIVEDKSGTKVKKAYQVLNEGMYVLEGVVRIEDSRVADCDIEEMNTMLVWGNFSQNGISQDEIAKLIGVHNVQEALFKGHDAAVPTQFAKYVQVGDIVFTASSDTKGFLTYSSEKTGEMVSYLAKSEENMAWFFKQMRAGNYWLLKSVDKSFEKVDIAAFFQDAKGAPLAKGMSQNKKYSGHWAGWLPNITRIETFFKINGFLPGTFKQDANQVWAVADVVTGATIAEFEGYAGILYKAYNK